MDLKNVEEATSGWIKELNRKSMDFRQQQDAMQSSLRLVEQKLNKQDAAPEFVRFRLYNDTWTSTFLYGGSMF